MTRQEILAECCIKYQEWLIEAKLKPAEMDDTNRMIFMAAYLIGYEAAQKRALEIVNAAAN